MRGLARDDSGSVSVEAALALSTLVLVLMAMVAALVTLGAYISAVDTAGAAARAAAIGLDYSPPRGRVSQTAAGGLVTVTAHIPAPLGEISAQAIFPEES
ncbi:hypothetical protein CPHO_01195 [Corynebacterium phocae]|uniref:TadE-like protein n=1 Tax=Corynebacterium phocae TaxID=161895 RepID=A0A1L7D6G9_9CORY|nr:hypothetical protein CPHO_01195 [Corynebacterium phocae]